jgi:AcrR family transcriptional regulator
VTEGGGRRTGATSNREAILDAASESILEGGARSLRVADVARRAGVSTPLLYYHFKSRSALVRAALDHSNAEAASTALLLAGGPGTAYDVVHTALMAELEDVPAVRRNAVIWNEVTTLAAFEEELREDVQQVTGGWHRVVAAAIARGIEDGSIDANVDPDVAAGILTAFLDGASVRWLAGALDLDTAREQLSLVLRSLLAPG